MSTPSSDPMIGRLLDGRYQVRSRIARGGMATVYLATDLRLERRVAIKVMHGHLADDEQYKIRFIQEARSAARLAHPNVVNVYDQGQDGETAYLVMEYLPGITLRDLLNDHHILTTEQAFDILEAVLSGLAAAHRSGIVHRDLKPENVLLADDGRIKISDFGLARAATANTATGTALMGTIAYLSPELVTRGTADARSDIYAVGIMLYEMLAGEQPFKGEQPFQVAQQHANDTVPAPSLLNPNVPAAFDELVAWATAREPDDRPSDAAEMLAELLVIQRELDRDAPEAAMNRTMVLPMAVESATDATQVIEPVVRLSAPTATLGPEADKLKRVSDRRRARGGWLVGLVLLLAAVAVGTGWYFGAGPGAKVTIATVAGLDVAAATAALQEQDLIVDDATTEAYDPTVPIGTVVGTNPPAGEAVDHGAVVTLILSAGPEPLPIPELVGLAEADALQAATDSRFTTTDSRYIFDGSTPGIVVQALGAGDVDLTTIETYGDQQPVTLVVSLGSIPEVSGMTVDDAQATLAQVGLTGQPAAEEYNDTVPAGNVIRAQAVQGESVVPQGGTVDLIISRGVEQVAVPNVVGKAWSEAKPILESAGFRLDYNIFADMAPGLFTVSKTNPDAESTVDKGTTIKVRFDS
ncbi:Stk1 family PASTA domain-containing Ser/Thr kinase [Homoserinimonas hongtaonis]|uniref:non-specific serine/threonine protein kinase n=1 Tax=Homoserinimonas hongtaonis TaxID=2079791 RepID=A0A2U1SY49_9MICO|nr:Stk1 family PASTA domain-containing Ser/Thr kinase [Salinibacterium hongtaonis]PWB96555.1 Stk1 family PASTA domain-containing Ser/Thr kinase [Salinibacterium hongtaonis]